VFSVSSDAAWLLVDSQMAIANAVAPLSFTVVASPGMLPTGVTSRANLTFTNRDDPEDIVVVPVEVSRGNVFDRTGEQSQGTCVGDCDGGNTVGIAELIRGVNIALGNAAVGTCPAFDTDADGQVGIAELVRAVLAALNGC
jgi:hypothetical protein